MNKNQVKETVRQFCLNHRKSLSPRQQHNRSQQVCSKIETLNQYQQSKQIALYTAAHGEIDLSTLWQDAKRSSKTFFFPAIQPNYTLAFLPATNYTSFKKKSFWNFRTRCFNQSGHFSQ